MNYLSCATDVSCLLKQTETTNVINAFIILEFSIETLSTFATEKKQLIPHYHDCE